MVDLIIKGGGSEIIDILTDPDLCDQYKIIDWDMDDNNNYQITINFNNVSDRNDFQFDYNIHLDDLEEEYIKEDHI